MTKTGFLVATTAIGLVLGATHANAAGFAIKETSGTQLGQAFAGAGALKGDVSAMWNNPATMTTLKGHHFAAAASYIMPSAKFKEGGSSTDQASNNGGDGGEKALVPALYAMWSIQDNMKLGLAVTVPFGLEIKYKEDSRLRHHAVKSALKTVNINPNVAYKVNDFVSLGLGVSFQRAEVELTRKLNQAPVGAADADFKAKGSDWGAGFNVGALVTPWEGGRIGVAYRSKISHGLDGETDVSTIHAGLVAAYGNNNVIAGKTDITADLTTSDSLDFSFAQDLGDAWTVMASAVWTRWNHFNELEIKRKSNGGTVGAVERQGWKNVWFFALGANWKMSENCTLRAGVAYDQSPINDTHRTVKLPGNDRTWLSAGADWKFADWGKVGLTYTHIFIKDGKINQTASAGTALANTVQGKVRNKVDIIGLQANFKF